MAHAASGNAAGITGDEPAQGPSPGGAPRCLRIVASLPTPLSHPKALAADADGRLFAGCASTGGGVVCWEADGTGGYSPAWHVSAGRVRGVACLSEGTVAATVRTGQSSQIHLFSSTGQRIAAWGKPGESPGQLSNPQGLVATADGLIATAEASAWDGAIAHSCNRVQIFTADGLCEACWGTTGQELGQLNLPVGIAVGGDGSLWVADTYNSRIQRFTRDGRLLACWGRLGARPGQLNCPQGLCVLPGGGVLVADTHNDRIQWFDDRGGLQWAWGAGRGSGPEQLWLPCAVAVDAWGRVLIADTMNHRIQIFEAAR